MKDIILSVYLVVLSIQDVYYKKIPVWLLLLAVAGGGSYCLLQQRGWKFCLDILPGALLCMISLFVPKALGIGDGLVGVIYGLFYGGLNACKSLMLAFVFVTVVGVIWCTGKKAKKVQIPFIPFLTTVHMIMQL